MNLIQLQKIKYKDKKNLINEICLMYKRMLKTKTLTQKALLFFGDPDKTDSRIINSKSVSMFDTILEILPKNEREVIVKDFIDREDSFWYLERYSKTKYYQIKNSAMNNFLYLFYK